MTRIKKHTFSNGYGVTMGLPENLESQRVRVQVNNKASMIVIDGIVGEGKTTLAVQCADIIQGSPINLKEQIGMGGQEFIKKFKICHKKKYPVIIYDEAGDFNKRGALTRFNAMMNRIFETYRAFKIVVIVVLPSFNILDKQLLDKGVARLLLHTENRNNFYGNYKGYSTYRMFYIAEKMKKLTVKPQAYTFTSPNFHGHFYDLIPSRSKELDFLGTTSKFNVLEETDIQLEGLLSYAMLCKEFGKSKTWVMERVLQLNVKPEKNFKNTLYFNKEIINLLIDFQDKEAREKDAKRKHPRFT